MAVDQYNNFPSMVRIPLQVTPPVTITTTPTDFVIASSVMPTTYAGLAAPDVILVDVTLRTVENTSGAGTNYLDGGANIKITDGVSTLIDNIAVFPDKSAYVASSAIGYPHAKPYITNCQPAAPAVGAGSIQIVLNATAKRDTLVVRDLDVSLVFLYGVPTWTVE